MKKIQSCGTMLAVFALLVGAVEAQQQDQPCGKCFNLPDLGNPAPINDQCTEVQVTFPPVQGADPNGKCKWTDVLGQVCTPKENCVFNMNITIITKPPCNPTYTSSYCQDLVNTNGQWTNTVFCQPEVAVQAGESSIVGWPVLCGHKDYLVIRRTLAGVVSVVASVGGACTECNDGPQPGGN